MEIEKLNKSQIILLTLLVSFVTSIATGIVTVSLMDQAPPAITQSVNRVVEHTVERVVSSAQTAAASTPAPGKTVVIKESDLIAAAVQEVSGSLVRLYSSGSDSPVFLGLGIVLDKSGVLLTDTNALGEFSDAFAVLPDGSRARAFVTSRDTGNDLAYLQAATSTSDGKALVWNPVTLAGGKITLGETVIMISGKNNVHVEDGIVTSLIPQDGAATLVDTNIPQAPIMFGSPIIDTDGNIVGISTGASRAISASAFIPASVLAPKPKAPDVKK